MPQISYIKYSDILKESSELRIEAEFYINLNKYKIKKFIFGKDIIDFVQYGTSKDLNEEQKGFPILRLNEFDGYYIGSPSKYSNLITKEIFESLKLKKGDVLICRTNGNPHYVGKSAICMENLEVGYASYLFRIRPNKEINSESLMIYLNSDYGRNEIEKHSMVSNQANFSPAKFRQIKIPLLPQSFQLQIEEIVKFAYRKQTQSKQLYREAEKLLLQELGLLDYRVKHSLWFATTKKEIDEAKRYDSEYFQPKYAEIIRKIEEYEGGYFKLSDKNYAKISRGSLIPDSFYNSEKGNPYIRGADFSSGILGNDKLVFIDDSFQKTRETMVRENDIVFSLIGSVGATAIVSKNFDNSFISNNTGKIRVINFDPVVLQIIFQSVVGKLQFEKEKTQTAQPKISSDQVGNFKIPLIKQSIQLQINEKIQESHRLRKESKKLLEEAKRKVEEEIERG